MTKQHRLMSGLLMTATAIGLTVMVPESQAEEFPLSKSKLIIEYNATANDVGVQVLLDGEPWKRMKIFKPNGIRLLDIIATNSLKDQGLTELFFESSEPNLADLSLEDFLKRFPAGVYEFEGIATDGVILEGEANFTHAIPAAPVVSNPSPAEVIDPNDLVIEWNAVTSAILPGLGPVTITGYQVIVEQPSPLRVLLMDLSVDVCSGSGACSVKIPPEFFVQKDAEHKFEVLAIEAGGNQTITESSLITQP